MLTDLERAGGYRQFPPESLKSALRVSAVTIKLIHKYQTRNRVPERHQRSAVVAARRQGPVREYLGLPEIAKSLEPNS